MENTIYELTCKYTGEFVLLRILIRDLQLAHPQFIICLLSPSFGLSLSKVHILLGANRVNESTLIPPL